MVVRILRLLSLLGAILWALAFAGVDAQMLDRANPSTPAGQIPDLPTASDQLTVPETLGQALRQMTEQSGAVFVGRVQAIHFDTAPLASQQAGTVTITLEVLTPIYAANGSLAGHYTLREWGGLWTMGRQRYAVGQRALFFLRPPNAAGISTPVGGQIGVVPLVPTTAQSFDTAVPQSGTAQSGTVPSRAAQPATLLDARLLAANLQRPVNSLLPYAGTSGLTLADAARIVSHPTLALEPTLRPLPGRLEPSTDPTANPQLPTPQLPIGADGIHPIHTSGTGPASR